MNNRYDSLEAIYNSPDSRSFINGMKKAGKSGNLILNLLQVISFIFAIVLGLVGYLITFKLFQNPIGVALGIIPLILLGVIAFIKGKGAAKKTKRYFDKHAPAMIAKAAGVEFSDSVSPELVNEASGGFFTPDACHRYGDIYMCNKFDESKKSYIIRELVYCVKGEYTPNSDFEAMLKKEVKDYTIKTENGNTYLYIPQAEGYLFGNYEILLSCLKMQYDYYNLGRTLQKAINGEEIESKIFDL